jgi:hypothetical protein
VEIAFSSDGKFKGFLQKQDGAEWRYAGDWELNEDVIHYTYRTSSLSDGPVELHDYDKILELNEKTLVVKDLDDGKIFTCERLK